MTEYIIRPRQACLVQTSSATGEVIIVEGGGECGSAAFPSPLL
jgi:hypothetical protein